MYIIHRTASFDNTSALWPCFKPRQIYFWIFDFLENFELNRSCTRPNGNCSPPMKMSVYENFENSLRRFFPGLLHMICPWSLDTWTVAPASEQAGQKKTSKQPNIRLGRTNNSRSLKICSFVVWWRLVFIIFRDLDQVFHNNWAPPTNLWSGWYRAELESRICLSHNCHFPSINTKH